MDYIVRPIAYIRNERSEALDDNWDDVVSTVELAQRRPERCADSVSRSSRTSRSSSSPTGPRTFRPRPWHRRPRGNENWPDVGVFAQRNKDRPNRILLSTVAIDELAERSFTTCAASTASTARRCSTSSRSFAGASRAANYGWRRGAKSSARTTSNSRSMKCRSGLGQFGTLLLLQEVTVRLRSSCAPEPFVPGTFAGGTCVSPPLVMASLSEKQQRNGLVALRRAPSTRRRWRRARGPSGDVGTNFGN